MPKTDPMPKTDSINVTLGDDQDRVDARIQSGAYASASDVIRAGLRALDREEAAMDAVLRQRIQEAIEDPRPSVPADQVFADLRARVAACVKAAKRDA